MRTLNQFMRRAGARVVKVRKQRNAKGALWPIKTSARKAGLDLVQDEDGRILLTRASSDGFVQAYALLDANGKPLRVEPGFRP
jgi:hypothetical protein